MQKSDHGPVEPDKEKVLYAVGQAIKDFITDKFGPDKVGFVVLMFDFGDHGRMNYLANAQRPDMIKALKELVSKLEADNSKVQ